MNVLLKIYFVGLIAFVERPDPHQMLALLVDAQQQNIAAASGERIPVHTPILVARADQCEGDCKPEHERIAKALLPAPQVLESQDQIDQLQRVLGDGGGWILDSLDVRFSVPNIQAKSFPQLTVLRSTPLSNPGIENRLPREAADFSSFEWVPDLSKTQPTPLRINHRLLDDALPPGLVASRLTLEGGTVKVYRLADVGNRIVPWGLEVLPQNSPLETLNERTPPGETRAMAVAVVVEIPLSACSVKVDARNIDPKKAQRSMVLTSDNCEGGEIEIAVLNLPSAEHTMHSPSGNAPPPASGIEIDRHFELYYELAECPPARAERPVPVFRRASLTESSPSILPSRQESKLLELLALDNRGLTGAAICISAQFGAR
jgi:hypothetical protein